MGAKNIPLKTLLHEIREIAAMIDVRVAQHGHVHLSRIEWEIAVAIVGLRTAALIQAALQQNSFMVYFQQKHRARGRARGPAELHLHSGRIA